MRWVLLDIEGGAGETRPREGSGANPSLLQRLLVTPQRTTTQGNGANLPNTPTDGANRPQTLKNSLPPTMTMTIEDQRQKLLLP